MRRKYFDEINQSRKYVWHFRSARFITNVSIQLSTWNGYFNDGFCFTLDVLARPREAVLNKVLPHIAHKSQCRQVKSDRIVGLFFPCKNISWELLTFNEIMVGDFRICKLKTFPATFFMVEGQNRHSCTRPVKSILYDFINFHPCQV